MQFQEFLRCIQSHFFYARIDNCGTMLMVLIILLGAFLSFDGAKISRLLWGVHMPTVLVSPHCLGCCLANVFLQPVSGSTWAHLVPVASP